MASLAKATLLRLKEIKGESGDTKRWEPDGRAVAVQLNPTSLRFQRSNNVAPGESQGQADSPKRMHPSSSPATVTFDLEFDTADEGTTERPIDVRTRSALLRQFTEQPKKGSNDKTLPPRAQFQWGPFIFNGLVTQFSEELDYFALDGTPLRSKVSITMEEQDLDYENALTARIAAAASVAAGFSFGASASVSAGAGLSASAGVGASAGLSAAAGIGASFSASASVSIGAGAGAGVSLSASADAVGAAGAGGGLALTGGGAGVAVTGAAGVAGFRLNAAPVVSARLTAGPSARASAGAGGVQASGRIVGSVAVSASGSASVSATGSASAGADASWT